MSDKTSRASEIEELSKLKEKGVITEEEFLSAKKELFEGQSEKGKAENKNPKKSKLKTILIIIGILFLLGIIGNSLNENTDEEINKEDEQEESTNQDISEDVIYSIGDMVTVGEIEWQLLSAENIGSVIYSGNPYIENCTADSGDYIKIQVKVTNNRDSLYSITGLILTDDRDRRFTEATDISMCVDDTVYILENINPGLTKTFTGIFEVPKDVTGLKLVADSTGGLFSGETNKYIGLGF